jgi:hypothetical protein
MRHLFLSTRLLAFVATLFLVGCESSPLAFLEPSGTGLRGGSHGARVSGAKKGSLSSRIDGLLHPSGGSTTKMGNTYY